MTRLITVIFITTLLGGCMVVPLDWRDRGGGHQHWDNGHNRGGGHQHWNNGHNRGGHSRNWRYDDRR